MKIYHVDAFTDTIFSGNPAGVCILTSSRDDKWKQSIANELNLSETAFIEGNGGDYSLRWFTPRREVDLCGHATLASAHILWGTGTLDEKKTARFNTRSGILTAVKKGAWIELNFPREEEKEAAAPAHLASALGIKPLYTGRNRMDYIVEAESEEIVKNISPDFTELKKIETRGIIVTAKSDSGEYDFVSRFFCPLLGIDEDPVTGSAHCCLGPYWEKKLHRDSFTARQLSERGGLLKVRVAGDRVFLEGQAVTVLTAELMG